MRSLTIGVKNLNIHFGQGTWSGRRLVVFHWKAPWTEPNSGVGAFNVGWYFWPLRRYEAWDENLYRMGLLQPHEPTPLKRHRAQFFAKFESVDIKD